MNLVGSGRGTFLLLDVVGLNSPLEFDSLPLALYPYFDHCVRSLNQFLDGLRVTDSMVHFGVVVPFWANECA